jgi:hypothetical protein
MHHSSTLNHPDLVETLIMELIPEWIWTFEIVVMEQLYFVCKRSMNLGIKE